MKVYDVRRQIAATPEAVWKLLTDPATLTAADLGVTRIDGTIGPGARLTLWSEASPDRAFPLRVTTFTPPSRLVWEGGMPLGVFRGVRTFTLTPKDGGVDFHMREEFTGPLLPLIWGAMPDLTASLEKFADGLKRAAEAAPTA